MAISCAVLGLYFSISESYLINLADGRVPDELCTMGAGKYRGLWLCHIAAWFLHSGKAALRYVAASVGSGVCGLGVVAGLLGWGSGS
jgi:hypothetical protein